ncbi:DUF2555 domain-containing protein [Leptolyngbya sp. BC1307]|uniref:protein IsiD n=1 Tax=Leptolyngbya sp. BC1307 TaxID=2029589 RepID=UPI0023E7AA0A|nr:DUF2555 domain-containing protein [Leptolyngbya sp. BC1307]
MQQSAEYRQSRPSAGSTANQASTHISAQEIAQMTPDDVAQLAQRLEQDEYNTAFAGLQDWHRLRAVAFQRSELVEPYMHLLDLEAYDES